jgi:uncharacterized repeat protein (TIGR01451 family)
MVNKRLLKSDVILTPYEANKEFTFNITGSLPSSNCLTGSSDFTIYTGIKSSTLFNKDLELQSFGQYQRLIYDQINKTYYQKYNGNLSTGSNIDRVDLETLTNIRSTNKEQSLEDSQKIVKIFPTEEGDLIKVLQISPKIISNKILGNSINLTSPFYNIIDDGNGNLIDDNNYSKPYVGNIFYKTGNIVITNQDYVGYFPSPPTGFNKTFYFTESGSKSVDLSTCIGTGTEILDYSTVNVITGSNSFNYNVSSSYLFITSSTVDDYYFYFNIKDITGNCSNYGKINFTIAPSCNLTFSASVTSSNATTNYIPTFNCDVDIIKSTSINCEFINSLQLDANVLYSGSRSNGVKDYNYTFYSNQTGIWEFSRNGGISYVSSSISSSFYTGSTRFDNDFQGIVRFNYNNNFVEYYYKINPLLEQPIVFDKINEYSNYLNYSSSCYPNVYKIVTNGQFPLGYNVLTTGDLGISKISSTDFSVVGSKGSFTTYVTSSNSTICSKTIYINGINSECSTNVDVFLNKTNTTNNYVILSDIDNKFISTYPQWVVKSGSIAFKSNGNSLYTEIEILDTTKTNILNLNFQDFCGNSYSKDFFFDYQYNITGNKIYGTNYDYFPTTVPPTTLYLPSTTTSAPIIPFVNLRLTQLASNRNVVNGEIVKLTMLVSNDGNTDATNVEVRNPLSGSMRFDSALTNGVRYTSSLVSAVLPMVKVNETIGFEYNVLVTGSFSSSFVNYSQIVSCDQVNSGSILGNGYNNSEIDESNLIFNILPSGSQSSSVAPTCLSFTITNNTSANSNYYWYDCFNTYKSGSLSYISGSNTVDICAYKLSDISYGGLTVVPNGQCSTIVTVPPIITKIFYSCDCGNNFFDPLQNTKGKIFIEASNPSGSLLDLEYSFEGDVNSKYQDLNYSNCLPNGLFTVFARLKSDNSKKTSQRVVIYCGTVSETCQTYRIINNTTSSVSLNYINCTGENISKSIVSSSNFDVCTRNREYITLSDDLLSIQQVGLCVQNSSSCDVSITSIVSSSNSIQINASSSLNLAYTIDGGWSWFENGGNFTNLSNGRYLAGVADTNYRTSCVTDYSLVNIGVTGSLTPRIDFYKVHQDSELLCNQFQSYIYCCIKSYNTSGTYQFKIVDKINNVIVRDWTQPVTTETVAFLQNHGTYQVLVRDVNNLYCQNMFDDLVISFANCV